jgi:hypothetical protein
LVEAALCLLGGRARPRIREPRPLASGQGDEGWERSGMKKLKEDRPRRSTADPQRGGDRGAMSPEIRQLILSFGEPGSDRTWDPDAYSRRPPQNSVSPRAA